MLIRKKIIGYGCFMSARGAVLNWIEQEKDQIIAFLQDFIRAKSPNPPGDTVLATQKIKYLLDKHNAPIRYVSPQPTMPNLIGSINGASEGRHLVLNGHIDVFPVSKKAKEEGWITSPWSGEIIDNKIYGRGSTDMKCGTSASIWTYIILNYFKNSIKGKLTLTCVSDEETFGPWGARWLMENEPDVLGDCCLNGEPSSPFTIRYAEKGLLWLTFKIQTDGSHGAYTHLSKSATRVAANLIKRLESLEDLELEIPKDLLEAQKGSASHFDKGMGAGAAEIAPKVTLNIGTINGGLKNNMVPSDCIFEADIRLPIGSEVEHVKSTFSLFTGRRHDENFTE